MTTQTFSTQLIEVLDYLCQKFGVAIDWTSANVLPILTDLAGHYLRWEITTSAFWIIISMLVLATGIFCLKHANSWEDKGVIEDSLYVILPVLIVFMVFLPVLICQVFDIIKCTQFPELQIIEYLSKLMKNM